MKILLPVDGSDISLEAVISREASLVTGRVSWLRVIGDPMRLPVIPASATGDAPDPKRFCPAFETLVIQNASGPPARGYPAC